MSKYCSSSLTYTPDSGWVDFFAVHPKDIAEIMQSSGLTLIELIGCEGGMAFLHHKTQELSTKEYKTVMEINYQFARDPAMLNASNHILYVGKKELDQSLQC